jgi:hypothetical protein
MSKGHGLEARETDDQKYITRNENFSDSYLDMHK